MSALPLIERRRRHREAVQLGVSEGMPLREAMRAVAQAHWRETEARLDQRAADRTTRRCGTPTNYRSWNAGWMMRD